MRRRTAHGQRRIPSDCPDLVGLTRRGRAIALRAAARGKLFQIAGVRNSANFWNCHVRNTQRLNGENTLKSRVRGA
jgi:hypothetical protein